MTSSSNKDIMFMIEANSQGDYGSTANLEAGYFLQIDDSSSKWIRMRRRDDGGGHSTLGTSSNSAFTQDAWQTCKISWNQTTGAIDTYMNGSLKLSVNDTTHSDFCPSCAGFRFMSARYMSPSSAYNELDWIKAWKS